MRVLFCVDGKQDKVVEPVTTLPTYCRRDRSKVAYIYKQNYLYISIIAIFYMYIILLNVFDIIH